MTTDPSREAFEKWARSLPDKPNLTREGAGYRYVYAECYWEAWQAAMDHKETERWQPIETAPKDGTKFLAYRPLAHMTHDLHIKIVRGVPNNYGCWESTVPSGYSFENFTDGACRATHWMPLPAATLQQGE